MWNVDEPDNAVYTTFQEDINDVGSWGVQQQSQSSIVRLLIMALADTLMVIMVIEGFSIKINRRSIVVEFSETDGNHRNRKEIQKCFLLFNIEGLCHNLCQMPIC